MTREGPRPSPTAAAGGPPASADSAALEPGAEPRPSLRRELLFNLGALVAAALTLAVGAALVVGMVQPGWAAAALVLLIAADVAIVFLFGRYLLNRLVLRPMAALNAAAQQLAAGHLGARAPAAETRDFTELAARFNLMTERLLDAQSQLVESEKLATIGRFAAGVAHEVGNPLAAIGMYLEVLRQRGADPELVAAVQHQAARIDRIVRGLLDYARGEPAPLGPVNVGQVIWTVHRLLDQQGALRQASVALECPAPLPPVLGNAQQLEQVLVNLVLNAVHAAGPGGRVAVGAVPWRYRTPANQPDARQSDTTGREPDRLAGLSSSAATTGQAGGAGPRHLTAASGLARGGAAAKQRRRSPLGSGPPWRPELADGTPGVLVYVADSGPGVPPSDRELVFEPFYTTKPPGEGTGLGLAVVRRIVHEAGGVVWVDDAREGGAAFKVFLRQADSAGGRVEPATGGTATGQGGAR